MVSPLNKLADSTFPSVLAAASVLFVSVLSLSLIGCGTGSGVYPVQGNVVSTTGIAPRFGTVEFRSVDEGRVASGVIQRDGTFLLTTFEPNDGAVAGVHKVILVRFINVEDGKPLHTHNHAVEIPERYASYETSGLTATVEPTRNNEITIEFEP